MRTMRDFPLGTGLRNFFGIWIVVLGVHLMTDDFVDEFFADVVERVKAAES